MPDLPSAMRAVQLRSYDGKPESLTLVEAPVPAPGPGQALVKVAASPINPSDLMFIRGLYGFRKPVPATPGFEGSGTVMAVGGGALAGFLKGKRVACHATDPATTGGMWAEYIVVPANACVPLRKNIDLEVGAMMLVNPFTAWALVEEARREKHKAMVQTAAASALGQMIVRLGKKFGIPTINVVRRNEQVELLRSAGAKHVLNSADPGFEAALRELSRQLGATIAFEAVGGELSRRILSAQPKGSRMLVYGGLSLQPVQADPGSLIFEGKSVEGFWLSAWLARKSLLARAGLAGQVQKLLGADLKSPIRARYPLADVARALSEYAANMTAGKALLVP
ncbi:MAG TPA: zinc-binding dehydrogenase [Terriglobales bacterium]|nr:zinc-binding dehydrogenase [Terriglobales bacterium]